MSWTYKHVVEIGAGDRASSDVLKMPLEQLQQIGRITLYEPNAILYGDLIKAKDIIQRRDTSGYKWPQPEWPFYSPIQIRNVAVIDAGFERVDLYHMGYASWVCGTPVFLPLSVEPEGLTFWEDLARPVRTIEPRSAVEKDVDLLILTANGSELTILSAMTARPQVIRTKHYCHCQAHWREAHKVFSWFREHGYRGQQLDRNQHGTFVSISWEKTS